VLTFGHNYVVEFDNVWMAQCLQDFDLSDSSDWKLHNKSITILPHLFLDPSLSFLVRKILLSQHPSLYRLDRKCLSQ